MPPSATLHHVSLEVTDIARTTWFYDRFLGELGFRRFVQEADYVAYTGDGLTIWLIKVRAPRIRRRPPTGDEEVIAEHLAFHVDSAARVSEVEAKLATSELYPIFRGEEHPEFRPGTSAPRGSTPTRSSSRCTRSPRPAPGRRAPRRSDRPRRDRSGDASGDPAERPAAGSRREREDPLDAADRPEPPAERRRVALRREDVDVRPRIVGVSRDGRAGLGVRGPHLGEDGPGRWHEVVERRVGRLADEPEAVALDHRLLEQRRGVPRRDRALHRDDPPGNLPLAVRVVRRGGDRPLHRDRRPDRLRRGVGDERHEVDERGPVGRREDRSGEAVPAIGPRRRPAIRRSRRTATGRRSPTQGGRGGTVPGASASTPRPGTQLRRARRSRSRCSRARSPPGSCSPTGRTRGPRSGRSPGRCRGIRSRNRAEPRIRARRSARTHRRGARRRTGPASGSAAGRA